MPQPNVNLIGIDPAAAIAMIAALAAQAPQQRRDGRRMPEALQPENDMEATCLALARRHEADNPNMNGLVGLVERSILAERAKNAEFAERLSDLEKGQKKQKNKLKNLRKRV